MRFKRRPRRSPRPITKRRLAISERTLRRQREALPLLSDWVAEQQPSAQERLESFQQNEAMREARWRKFEAVTWKRARRLLRLLPYEVRVKVLDDWNLSPCPGDPSYFAEYVWEGAKPLVESGQVVIPDELDPSKRLEQLLRVYQKHRLDQVAKYHT